MYNLAYTVPFTNVDGESLTVQILEDDGTGTPIELTGGTPPFTVDINDEDFLYTPTRFSGATLKLVGSDYLQRLFSTQYQKFKVNLIKGSSVIWTGFITPELYSQDYDNSLFELEIECISALSTLEYIDFKQEGLTISLLGLIRKCITESKGDFKAVYIPNTYTSSLDGISVSTANFIDEDGKAMTLKECLEEICKFLNWTVTEYDGNVYFIDVDYIKAGKTTYTNILTNSSSTLSSVITLQDIPSKGNSNNLSILGGYNKVVIIDSDYEIDKNRLYPENDFYWQAPMRSESIVSGKKTYIKQYAESDSFDKHFYIKNSTEYVKSGEGFDSKNNKSAGCFFVRRVEYDNEDKPNRLDYENVFEIKQLDDIGTGEKKYLYDNTDTNIVKYPVITTNKESTTIIIDNEFKLAISFSIQLSNTGNGFITDELITPTVDKLDTNSIYVFAKLRIGDKYYTGTTWTSDSKSVFKIYTDVKKETLYNSWFNAKDTNSFEIGVSNLTGTIINVDQILIGDIELTLYNPIVPVLGKAEGLASILAIKHIYFKDIKIESQRINKNEKTTEKQDTKYENVVNENYINALEDIEFKITSKNDSELSFSKAIIGSSLLDTLTNTIYNSNEKPEKLLIQRIINQYKQPKIKLTQIIKPTILPYSIIIDNYLAGRKFVFTGGTINFEDNSIECNLMELN